MDKKKIKIKFRLRYKLIPWEYEIRPENELNLFTWNLITNMTSWPICGVYRES